MDALGTKRREDLLAIDGHWSRFLYMASMRWVTKKPPKMFTEARISAAKPSHRDQPDPAPPIASRLPTPTASSAPTTMTLEMALVTDISGVCSAGVTDQTT